MHSKKIYHNKIFFTGLIMTFGLLSAVFCIGFDKFTKTTAEAIIIEKKVIYPKVFSDENITRNAIVSDPKFRGLATLRSDTLLANTISAVKQNDYVETSTELEKGTWLWTDTLAITPEYRDEIITGAKKNGIKNIYISIDTYLDIYVMPEGEAKKEITQKFDNVLKDFIKTAHENGITVDAEAGWRNWAEMGHTYKAFAILDYVINFNSKYQEKFRGFQYDVEPYILSYYENNKKPVLSNFVNLIDETVARLNGSDLELSVVIPEFYDGKDGITPKFYYGGKSDYTLNHLLTVLDRRPGSKIIVMSYRNLSQGDDGSIDVSLNEIDEANSHYSRIIIAQETGDVKPPFITFFNTSRSFFDKQIDILENTFSFEKSYGGIAIHYINSFLELK